MLKAIFLRYESEIDQEAAATRNRRSCRSIAAEKKRTRKNSVNVGPIFGMFYQPTESWLSRPPMNVSNVGASTFCVPVGAPLLILLLLLLPFFLLLISCLLCIHRVAICPVFFPFSVISPSPHRYSITHSSRLHSPDSYWSNMTSWSCLSQ